MSHPKPLPHCSRAEGVFSSKRRSDAVSGTCCCASTYLRLDDKIVPYFSTYRIPRRLEITVQRCWRQLLGLPPEVARKCACYLQRKQGGLCRRCKFPIKVFSPLLRPCVSKPPCYSTRSVCGLPFQPRAQGTSQVWLSTYNVALVYPPTNAAAAGCPGMRTPRYRSV